MIQGIHGKNSIYQLDDDEILTMDEMEPVGTYDGEDIEWASFDEYNDHLKRKGEDKEEKEENELFNFCDFVYVSIGLVIISKCISKRGGVFP